MLRNTYIQTTFLFYEESLYEKCSLDRVEVLLKEIKVMTNVAINLSNFSTLNNSDIYVTNKKNTLNSLSKMVY